MPHVITGKCLGENCREPAGWGTPSGGPLVPGTSPEAWHACSPEGAMRAPRRGPVPCADICPADCIHPVKYKNQRIMIIDPKICLDCGVCLPECPAGAITGSTDENPQWTKINRKLVPK